MKKKKGKYKKGGRATSSGCKGKNKRKKPMYSPVLTHQSSIRGISMAKGRECSFLSSANLPLLNK